MKVIRLNNNLSLAEQAAKLTVERLRAAILENGEATWVLSGGTSPTQAYEVVVQDYGVQLDWQKVWFCLGDERHVSIDGSYSNWAQVSNTLLKGIFIDQKKAIIPNYNSDVRAMAKHYERDLNKLPKNENGLPRLDMIWLGLGEDGHTLSLFPGHNLELDDLVVSIFNSPKPPDQRISLSLHALKSARSCIILAAGENKADAVASLVEEDIELPITQAVKTIEAAGGEVILLIDEEAAEFI